MGTNEVMRKTLELAQGQLKNYRRLEVSREHFYGDEEKTLNRLLMLQSLVGEQQLHPKPCPLLAAQLNELSVLCGRLQADIRKLKECVKAAGYEA